MEEHTTTERGRLFLESMGYLYCRESQKYSPRLPKHRASTVGQEGAARGKLECHKPQGWESAHSVCQEEGLALTRPLSMCFGHPRSGSCYRDSSGNRGRGRQLNRVGRVNSTLQKVSVFLLTMELSTPSTHPVPSRIPLSASPAPVPERSMDLTVGEQASWVGSKAL